jgi:hypothetical protein
MPCYISKKSAKMQNEIDQLTGIERYSVFFLGRFFRYLFSGSLFTLIEETVHPSLPAIQLHVPLATTPYTG